MAEAPASVSDLRRSLPIKTCASVTPLYGLPVLYPPPPPPPPLAAVNIGNNAVNLPKTMSNFTFKHSCDYSGYPYDFFLPEDIYQEDDQMPAFDDSVIGEDPIWWGNEGSSRLQAKFSEPQDDLLGDAYENSYLHQDYWYNDNEIDFNGFHSEPVHHAQFPMAYHGCPNYAVSGLKFYQPNGQTDSEDNYDRISQVWSSSVANMGKLPNDFDNDSVEGKCIGKGCHYEDTLHEAKNFGSYFGRSKNSNLMEKDEAHIFEHSVDHFSSGHNASGNVFEDFSPSLCRFERQKQPVQNTSITAETEEKLRVELQQAIASLTAYVGRLEIQVEHLTHQVQDMADKLSGENNFIVPVLDHSVDSKTVLEQSEIISSAGEATLSKLLVGTEDSSQNPDETGWTDESSTSDWEII